jgi:hypothetical protein
MNLTAAQSLVAIYQAAWPSREVADSTWQVWSDALVESGLDFGEARQGLAELVMTQVFPPAIAELIDAGRQVAWRNRPAALPPPPREIAHCRHHRLMSEPCDQCYADIHGIFESFRGKWAEAKQDAIDPDHEATVALARLNALPLSRRFVCEGTGERPVERGGQWVCPGCGAPIEPQKAGAFAS